MYLMYYEDAEGKKVYTLQASFLQQPLVNSAICL